MTVTYQDPEKKKIIRQPLLKRIRAFYRGPRKTSTENLFYQKIYLDIKRIYIELELINTKIFNKVKTFIGAENSSTHQLDTSTDSSYYGAKYYDLNLDGVSFFNAHAAATPSLEDESTKLYTTAAIAAKLANLNFKINQLERRVR
jgi:hypothetical protein